MNKLKFLIASLTAVAMTMSCGALVACGGDDDKPNTDITKPGDDDTNKPGTDDTNKPGDDDTNTPGDDDTNKPGDDDGDDDDATTYTITLNAGDGTLDADASLTYKTGNDGKIILGDDEYLPVPEATTENWSFFGWYDAETGGNEIDETTATFTADTTLYARYAQKNGLWNEDGSELVAAVSINTGDTTCTNYWLGGMDDTITLEADTVLTVYLNGKQFENFWLVGTCIDLSADVNNYGGVTTSTVTVTENADFQIYLKVYDNGGTTFEFNGIANDVATTDKIPEGCDAITVRGTNGSVTLYLVDAEGNAVGEDRFDEFKLYVGSPEIFEGGWNGSPLLSALATTTGTGDIVGTQCFIFRYGTDFGNQTSNIYKIEVGNTYVINLSVANDKAFLYVAPDAE